MKKLLFLYVGLIVFFSSKGVVICPGDNIRYDKEGKCWCFWNPDRQESKTNVECGMSQSKTQLYCPDGCVCINKDRCEGEYPCKIR